MPEDAYVCVVVCRPLAILIVSFTPSPQSIPRSQAALVISENDESLALTVIDHMLPTGYFWVPVMIQLIGGTSKRQCLMGKSWDSRSDGVNQVGDAGVKFG